MIRLERYWCNSSCLLGKVACTLVVGTGDMCHMHVMYDIIQRVDCHGWIIIGEGCPSLLIYATVTIILSNILDWGESVNTGEYMDPVGSHWIRFTLFWFNLSDISTPGFYFFLKHLNFPLNLFFFFSRSIIFSPTRSIFERRA